MTVAGIVLLAAAGLVALFGAWALVEARRIRRDADRMVERILANSAGQTNGLVDRLLHVTGNTWTLPPSLASETRREPESEPERSTVRVDVESFFADTYAPAEAELVSSNGAGAVL